MKSICRLCLKESRLSNSHIIPEYFYKPMYDSNNRFFKLSLEPDKQNEFVQKGLREYLLCNTCEQHINEYEKYANRVMFYEPPEKINQNSKIVIVEGIDYKLMKLFQLSVLWRAAVSSLPTFQEVKLGPHQERIRKMILNNNPGKYTDYGCLQTAIFMEEKKLANGLVMAVELIRIEGYRIYRFVFGGIIWLFYVSSHNDSFILKNLFLQEDGTLTIAKYPFEEVKFLMDFGIDLHKQGKLNAS